MILIHVILNLHIEALSNHLLNLFYFAFHLCIYHIHFFCLIALWNQVIVLLELMNYRVFFCILQDQLFQSSNWFANIILIFLIDLKHVLICHLRQVIDIFLLGMVALKLNRLQNLKFVYLFKNYHFSIITCSKLCSCIERARLISDLGGSLP